MIIGQFIDTYHPVIDGVVQTVANYQRELALRGDRGIVVAPAAPGYEDPPGAEVLRYHSYAIPQRPPYRVGIPQIDIRLRRLIDRYPMELVHVHSPFTCGSLGLSVARRRGLPIVGTFHSKYYDDFVQATRSEVIARTAVQSIAHFYERLDEAWTVSEATAATLREYGYRGPITVIENGTDMPMPEKPGEVARRARTFFTISEDIPVLLFVGQHVWQKNVKLILEGMAALKERGARFLLLMAGEGGDQAAVDALIVKLGIDDVVRRLGIVRDRNLLAGLYLSARMLVFPSLYDNAPLVMREAASLRLPSLLVRGATCAQDVTHGDNGFLCENDPIDMARVIEDILCDEPTRVAAGLGASQTLATPWSSIVDRVCERYAYLIHAYNLGKVRV